MAGVGVRWVPRWSGREGRGRGSCRVHGFRDVYLSRHWGPSSADPVPVGRLSLDDESQCPLIKFSDNVLLRDGQVVLDE